MKDQKNTAYSLEALVDETLNFLSHNQGNVIKLIYLDQLKSYRLEWNGNYLDFPKSLGVIKDLINGSYLNLRSYDMDLFMALKSFLNSNEQIYLYIFGDDIFLKFQEIEDIKKAA